jgi:uncharacterized membrane protein
MTTRRSRALGLLRLDVAGVAAAVLFYGLSLTPSLLPRDWLTGGVISGISAAIGYGMGVLLAAGARRVAPAGWRRWRQDSRARRKLQAAAVSGAVGAAALMALPAASWQRELAALMGIGGPGPDWYPRTLVVALLVAAGLIALARAVLGSISATARWMIRRWRVDEEVALFVGTAIVVALLVTLANGVVLRGSLAPASAVFQTQNAATRAGVGQPDVPQRSGSPQSFVAWDSLGFQGRNFTGTGPRAAELGRLNGGPAKEPIRVYAGLQSADTVEGRVALLLSELARTRAWERKLLVIIPTTGTGWVDPIAARSIESIYNGDTALVAMQYSYLPSWISFLADRDTSVASGRAMVDAVARRWSRLPPRARPSLAIYGESLGAMAGQDAFGYLHDIEDLGFSSALWVGPPNASTLWAGLTARRDPGTPEVQPRYDNGRTVRFAQSQSPAEIAAVAAPPWRGARVLFLQHPSDPVVWWSPELLFERPDWLSEFPGFDRSPSMRWYPIVTFWQVSADMAGNVTDPTGTPPGHGHDYADLQLDGWVAVAAPPHWTGSDTERIRRRLDEVIAEGGPEFA